MVLTTARMITITKIGSTAGWPPKPISTAVTITTEAMLVAQCHHPRIPYDAYDMTNGRNPSADQPIAGLVAAANRISSGKITATGRATRPQPDRMPSTKPVIYARANAASAAHATTRHASGAVDATSAMIG